MAITLAELRQRHKEMLEGNNSQDQKSAGNDKWYSLQDGDNLVRFLPGKEDPLQFFVEGSVHKYQDSNGGWRNYKCRKPIGEKCPLCEFHYNLWDRHRSLDLGKTADGKNVPSKFGNLATQLRVKPRYYAIAVIRALQEKGENPVRYVAMSQQLFDRVMACMVNDDFLDSEDPNETTIISLDRGNDFNIRVTKQGKWLSFTESTAKFKKTKAGTPAEMAAWMENDLSLDTLVVPDSYEDGRNIVEMLESSLHSVGASSSSSSNESDEVDDEKFQRELKS